MFFEYDGVALRRIGIAEREESGGDVHPTQRRTQALKVRCHTAARRWEVAQQEKIGARAQMQNGECTMHNGLCGVTCIMGNPTS